MIRGVTVLQTLVERLSMSRGTSLVNMDRKPERSESGVSVWVCFLVLSPINFMRSELSIIEPRLGMFFRSSDTWAFVSAANCGRALAWRTVKYDGQARELQNYRSQTPLLKIWYFIRNLMLPQGHRLPVRILQIMAAPLPLMSCPIESIAFEWLGTFISDLESSDTPDGLSLENSFVDDSYWRDLLAFTPDYRTLYTRQRIQQYLSRSVAVARPTRFDILPDVRFKDAGADKTFVQGIVQFQTVIAVCTGIFTLAQSDLGKWKAWCFVTIMDGLHGVADHYLNRNGSMALNRPFERKDVMQYKAVVLGAGQCGLAVAARLKNAGVSTLVLEKSNAVGNSWRTRYKSLETNTPRVFSKYW